jgi:hypothetical protein
MSRVLYWLRLYRPLMRLAHRFHWHYAPPLYPDGDTILWCQWCGFRAVVKRCGDKPLIANAPPSEGRHA